MPTDEMRLPGVDWRFSRSPVVPSEGLEPGASRAGQAWDWDSLKPSGSRSCSLGFLKRHEELGRVPREMHWFQVQQGPLRGQETAHFTTLKFTSSVSVLRGRRNSRAPPWVASLPSSSQRHGQQGSQVAVGYRSWTYGTWPMLAQQPCSEMFH